MVVLAVMAAGAHTMSIAAPAMAEQERLALEAEAAAERAIVPNPAAADGLPVPALLGGIVVAFAVGLSAGQVQRRRRVARRSAEARLRPAPAPTPIVPVRPAPPPPEPAAPPEPKPVEIAAPPPAPPPPPPVRSRGQRILRFRPAPAPAAPAPEPAADTGQTADEIMAEPVVAPPADEAAAAPPEEVVADKTAAAAPREEVAADEAAPAPREEVAASKAAAPPEEVVADEIAAAPSGPEVPRRDVAPPARPVAKPLAEAPEALRPVPAPRPQSEPVVVPARRFARWPAEAETLWTCEVAWKAGYVKSTFRAMAGPPGASRRKSLGESPSLRWTLMTDPEPPTPEMIASVKLLVSALVEAGWERVGPGHAWYAQRFIWRGSGEPGIVEVPDEIESAEPPPR